MIARVAAFATIGLSLSISLGLFIGRFIRRGAREMPPPPDEETQP